MSSSQAPHGTSETALITAAMTAGFDLGALRDAHPRVDVLPFDSARRFMATVHQRPDGGRVGYLKGAVEEVLARCADADNDAVLRHQRTTSVPRLARSVAGRRTGPAESPPGEPHGVVQW